MEFILGGVAACGAGFFTNPLEVVKTRLQLQGELQARGLYTVHYKNVFHAFYTIARNDGILALQNGLVPALWYQLFMNGIRLGAYQTFVNWGLTETNEGKTSAPRMVLAGAVAGCLGACIGSPMYMIKTHLQAQAASSIAVGYQHHHEGMSTALLQVYKKNGIKGLWRGVTAAIPRVTFGSACQLATFDKSREIIQSFNFSKEAPLLSVLIASMLSGVGVSIVMTPFDVVSTRIYNQGVNKQGKGLLYSGVFDCFIKMFRQEGFLGFYKGWSASFLRLGPHTTLSLFFWNQLRKFYFDERKEKEFHYSTGSE